jgi:hypothetical protein
MPGSGRPDLLIKMGYEVRGANFTATTGGLRPKNDAATLCLKGFSSIAAASIWLVMGIPMPMSLG